MENGWKHISQVSIPPIDTSRSEELVKNREYIKPINYGQEVQAKNEVQENETVLVNRDQDHDQIKTVKLDDEEETVLLSQEEETVLLENYESQIVTIKRVKTNETFIINKEVFVIGKGSYCDFVVEGNPTISRKHARIIKRNDSYFIEDLNSSNHTLVNDQVITHPVELKNGMEFYLSNELFQFFVSNGDK